MTLSIFSFVETTQRRPVRSRATHVWSLRQCPIFRDVHPAALETIAAEATSATFRKGDILSEATAKVSDSVQIVLQGQVKLCGRTPTGRDLIVDILAEGDAFGDALQDPRLVLTNVPASPEMIETVPVLAFTDPEEIAVRAVAMTDGTLLSFEAEKFRTLLQDRPALVVNLSRFLGARRRRLEMRLARLLYRTSSGKIAGLLVDLAEHHGEPAEEGGTRVTLRLTHQEIAALVGIKRETVSEVLAKLEADGFIRYSRRELVVLEPVKLLRVA